MNRASGNSETGDFWKIKGFPFFFPVRNLANLTNENTRRAYRTDVASFMRFVGIKAPGEFRTVRRAHVIAWRKILEKQKLAPATVRRKMSALSDLFNYLCDKNAIADNPVHGVERPKEGANQGKTPAISDAQAAALLDAPSPQTLKGKRDRAILAVLLFHAVRRAELCALRVKDYAERQGVKHFCIHGKGSKIRYLPVNPAAARRIEEYIDAAGIRDNPSGPLFRVATANKMGPKLSPDSVYRNVVRYYGKRLGISIDGLTGPVSRITTLFLKFVCSDFNGRNTKARS